MAGPRRGPAGRQTKFTILLTILRSESAAAGALARRHRTDVTRPRFTHASHSKSPERRRVRLSSLRNYTTNMATASPVGEHSRRQARAARRHRASRGRRRDPRGTRTHLFPPARRWMDSERRRVNPPTRTDKIERRRRIAVSTPDVHPARHERSAQNATCRFLRAILAFSSTDVTSLSIGNRGE